VSNLSNKIVFASLQDILSVATLRTFSREQLFVWILDVTDYVDLLPWQNSAVNRWIVWIVYIYICIVYTCVLNNVYLSTAKTSSSIAEAYKLYKLFAIDLE